MKFFLNASVLCILIITCDSRWHDKVSLPPEVEKRVGKLHNAAKVASEENQEFWENEGLKGISASLEKTLLKTRIAKNIIIFIGDGMSNPTLTAARIYKEQRDNNNFETPERSALFFETFPHLGLSKTFNINSQVPDSASTAAAMFSGVKTISGTFGYDSSIVPGDPESMKTATRVKNILNWAQESGKDTGFVTTARVTHATPGALYAHTASRGWECDKKLPQNANDTQDIAWQLVNGDLGKNLKVALGGGLPCFEVRSPPQRPFNQHDIVSNDDNQSVSCFQVM